jgi:hypothetical protein
LGRLSLGGYMLQARQSGCCLVHLHIGKRTILEDHGDRFAVTLDLSFRQLCEVHG